MLKVSVVVLCLVSAALCGPPVSKSRREIQEFRDFLEGTRTDKGLRFGSSPQGSVWENSGKYQGDILLDDEQIESMVEQFSAGRNAYIWPNTRWPDRTIVYDFAPGQFTNAQMNHIEHINRIIEDRTCVRFRRRQNNEFNHVLITTRPDGCYASVGYWGDRGEHTLNLASDLPGQGCFHDIVVIHEWLHVIGFFHMQSTHDRDDYVRINWENVVRGMEHNFDRYGPDLVSNLGLPYEYDSCMHYGPHAFTTNGRTTIDALRPHSGIMGQMDYVTGFDFWRVDRHYGCSPWKSVEDYKPFYPNATVKVNGERND